MIKHKVFVGAKTNDVGYCLQQFNGWCKDKSVRVISIQASECHWSNYQNIMVFYEDIIKDDEEI